MKDIFAEICFGLTKENKKDTNRKIRGLLGVVYPDSAKIGTTANTINKLKGLAHQPWHHSQAHT